MKKLIVLIALLLVMPLNAKAATWGEEKVIAPNSAYGSLSAREKAWEGNNPTELEVYITRSSGYIYMQFAINNLKDVDFIPGSNITVVSKNMQDGNLTLLLKTTNNAAITSKTLIGTAYGYPIDTATGCTLNPVPLTLSCANLNNLFFDKNGKVVTETEFAAVCSSTNPGEDVETGSAIPYVAVMGGLIAIAGVYLYSRKTNKMYKL